MAVIFNSQPKEDVSNATSSACNAPQPFAEFETAADAGLA